MRLAQPSARVDRSLVFAQLVLACIAGLVLAPSLLAEPARAVPPGPQNLPALGWLAVGLLASAWLLALAPSLVHVVADALAASRRRVLVNAPASTPAEVHNLARWLVAFGEILLIQAMLRPALVVLLGASLSKVNAEALIAAITLVTLLVVLIWVHRSARPLVETAARSTLDVFLASTDSDTTVPATVSPTATTLRAGRTASEIATRPAPPLEATVAAPATLAGEGGETRLASNEETLPKLDTTHPNGTTRPEGER